MADFTVIVASGATVQDWTDPAGASGAPSRVNARPGYPLKRYVARRGVQVVLKAVVGGVLAPADGTLGGRLFIPECIEAPGGPFSDFIPTLGYSSIITVPVWRVGHHTIRIARPDGGNEHIHFDAGL
jgi:hypothetical protein